MKACQAFTASMVIHACQQRNKVCQCSHSLSPQDALSDFSRKATALAATSSPSIASIPESFHSF
eukprot:scaffold247942_cov9-Tisochrysis_lutea.AAC.1